MIKTDYQKARSNYLAKVRKLEKQGYIVERIPVPKKPTQASIRKLQKQTTKKLKENAPIVDILTGEIVKELTTSKRKKIEKNNEILFKYQKDIQKEFKRPSLDFKMPKVTTIAKSLDLPTDTDIIIQNFEASIDLFIPPVRDFINKRLEELTNTPEKRVAFAKAIKENPDYVPVPEDSDDKTIAYKFAELARIMNMKLEEMQEVTDTTDIIEQE